MDKKAMTWGIILATGIGLFLLVVMIVIVGGKFFSAEKESDVMLTPSLCIDKKATPKSFLLRVQPFAARMTTTGWDNPLYEEIYSPQLAVDEFIIYRDCAYKDRIFNMNEDKEIHKGIVDCGHAALVNLYLDYKSAIAKSDDSAEKKVLNTKLKAVSSLAKSLRYTGSLSDKSVADVCKLDPTLK